MTVPFGTPEIEPLLIRWHVGLIHELAERFGGPGKLVIAGFGEDPDQTDSSTGKPGRRLPPQVVHADVGDVRQSLTGLSPFVKRPHQNVYMPLAIFQQDLPSFAKGYERDVIACLGLVADFDDPEAARWASRLPMPPNYVLETSSDRFQAFYFFDKPEVLEAAKPVAERLKAFAQCDHGTSDMSHVWRVPGALNWPNAKKVAEGRPRVAQLVRVKKRFDGTTSLQALSNALSLSGPTADHKESTPRPRRKQGKTQASADDGQQAHNPVMHSLHKAAVDGTPENLDMLRRASTVA
jgi:DNA primase RepB-like protein